jgi:formate dehydrogenase subunit gamma
VGRTGPPGDDRLRLLRFDGVQRTAHWATATLFGILIVTALPLYFGSIATSLGSRQLLIDIHVWTGLVLPVPVVASLLGPWGQRMRRDAHRARYWTRDEVRWLWEAGRADGSRVVDKYNPAQKLNMIFTAGAIVVMLATGCILHWFGVFPVSWRAGATFVHDTMAFLIVIVIACHVTFACTHPSALRSMFTGRITRGWAKRHAPGWLDELDAGKTRPADPVRGAG